MRKCIDLTGQKFGRLTVIKYVGKSNWLCKCDCGNEKIVSTTHLKNDTKSCGCLKKEMLSQRSKPKNFTNKKHGLYNEKIYKTWKSIRQRCNNKNNKRYKDYGGRGITICNEWNDFKNFYDWALNNGYKENLTIDRINNNKGYSPENCRWADKITQSNNRRNNRNYTYNNETHTIGEWANIYNVNYFSLRSRLNRGWDIKKALETEYKK